MIKGFGSFFAWIGMPRVFGAGGGTVGERLGKLSVDELANEEELKDEGGVRRVLGRMGGGYVDEACVAAILIE